MQIRLRRVMKQRRNSRSIRLHIAEDYKIANDCDQNRSTPRADAQRLAIRCNIANRRDRNRCCKLFRSDKPFVTW